MSHFLLYPLIPDPDLEGSLEAELEQCFLGGLGCTSISDSLPSSEPLKLETTENLDALLKYPFLHSVSLCFNLYTLQYMMCRVLFPFIDHMDIKYQITFLQPLCQLLVQH